MRTVNITCNQWINVGRFIHTKLKTGCAFGSLLLKTISECSYSVVD
jgi:hypothetical protein